MNIINEDETSSSNVKKPDKYQRKMTRIRLQEENEKQVLPYTFSTENIYF